MIGSGPGAVDLLDVTFDQLQERLHFGIQLGMDPKVCHILPGHRGTELVGDSAKSSWITGSVSGFATTTRPMGRQSGMALKMKRKRENGTP